MQVKREKSDLRSHTLLGAPDAFLLKRIKCLVQSPPLAAITSGRGQSASVPVLSASRIALLGSSITLTMTAAPLLRDTSPLRVVVS